MTNAQRRFWATATLATFQDPGRKQRALKLGLFLGDHGAADRPMVATMPSMCSVLLSFAGLRFPVGVLGDGDVGGHLASQTKCRE
jgi:hypothetical protein